MEFSVEFWIPDPSRPLKIVCILLVFLNYIFHYCTLTHIVTHVNWILPH